MEIHKKIVKHVLKFYFKHGFVILDAKRWTYYFKHHATYSYSGVRINGEMI